MHNACECYALELWTASAFHCMRILELAFRALARHVGAELKEDFDYADWGALDRAVRSAIDDAQQNTPRGKAKSDKLEFLMRCALDLGYFGPAWRHPICHARQTYDVRTARDMLDRVSQFIDRLASGLVL
jgi:hypothetical protein